MSSLADRIKISQLYYRHGDSQDERNIFISKVDVDVPDYSEINLSVQFLLNCGSPLSCHGGSALHAYKFIQDFGYVPYDTCQSYIACSSESQEGFCPHVDTSCSDINICKTCSRDANGVGHCEAVSFYIIVFPFSFLAMPHIYHVCSTSFESLKLTSFPNATVAEYGSYDLNDTVEMIMAEIYARGPVKAAVNGTAITEYQGGIINDPSFANMGHSHGVSLVGWGTDSSTDRKHWIVRNSWGQYWGEMGFFRVEMGSNLLGIESHLAWATPGRYSTWNFPCDEQGSNCKGRGSVSYVDPSNHMSLLEQQ